MKPVISFVMDVKMHIKSINRLRKLFKKWPKLVYSISRKKFPITAETGNSKKNEGAIHVFIKDDYEYLKSAGDVCLNIGNNIGDSSIWYALKGFSKITAVEPYPQNFVNLKKNGKENGLETPIICINKSPSSSRRNIIIDDSVIVARGFDLHESIDRILVELVSLGNLVAFAGGSSLCLNMDCGGCEYDQISNFDSGTLLKFPRIVMEYHYRFEGLATNLKKCGFNVRHSLPQAHINQDKSNKIMITGHLYSTLGGI